MLRISVAATALFFLLQVPVWPEKVFVWTDDKGVKHFSNTGPSESAEDFRQEEELPEEAASGKRSAGRTIGPTPPSKTPAGTEPQGESANPPSPETKPDAEAAYIEATRLDLMVFPLPQDELVQREKSIVADLRQQAEQTGVDRRQMAHLERKRLTLAVQDLEEAPLDKFGSQKNKRRQVGYYKYRLEKLLADPDGYFKYPESEFD